MVKLAQNQMSHPVMVPLSTARMVKLVTTGTTTPRVYPKTTVAHTVGKAASAYLAIRGRSRGAGW
jgi:hypothetical protein